MSNFSGKGTDFILDGNDGIHRTVTIQEIPKPQQNRPQIVENKLFVSAKPF